MMNIDSLLGMILTEYIENCDENYSGEIVKKDNENLPPIDYTTELIRNSDGSLEWYD